MSADDQDMETFRTARRCATALAVAALVSLGTARPAAAASCPPGGMGGGEGELASLLNAERTSRGLAPLAHHDGLASYARPHAVAMAAAGSIWHNELFMSSIEVLDAWLLAENVGMACSVSQAHSALMASTPHKANILDARLTHVGVGVASDLMGRIFVVQGFARFTAPAPPPAPAPAAPPPAQVTQAAPKPAAQPVQAPASQPIEPPPPPPVEPEPEPVPVDPEPEMKPQAVPVAATADTAEPARRFVPDPLPVATAGARASAEAAALGTVALALWLVGAFALLRPRPVQVPW